MTPFHVKNKKSRHSTSSNATLFCSSHALKLSVILNSTGIRKNDVHLLNMGLEEQHVIRVHHVIHLDQLIIHFMLL